MPQGAGPLISWRPPASRQPSRGPQGLIVLMGLLVPVLLIIGVSAVVNRSPRDVTGPEVTWPPEVQVTRTSEARATHEARATQASETRPPTPEPTISFPQVEVPPLPSWLPPHDWEELPTTGDKVSDKLVAHPNQQDELSRREPSCSTEGVQESRTAHRLLHVRDQLSSGRVASLPDRSRHPTEARQPGCLRRGRQYPCGSERQGKTAFYCPANATIYLSRNVYEFEAEDGFYAGDTVVHEHFHHIQNQLGITRYARTYFDADEMEVSRRIELQGICSTSRLQLTLNMGVDADIYATFLKYSLGDEQHGTKETID